MVRHSRYALCPKRLLRLCVVLLPNVSLPNVSLPNVSLPNVLLPNVLLRVVLVRVVLVRVVLVGAVFCWVVFFNVDLVRGESLWPQFRGPGSRGVADSDRLPTRWSATENVEWKTALPGRGWSSPVVWGKHVFLTSVVNDGTSEKPKKGLYFGGNRPEPPSSNHRWLVHCLDLESGVPLWQREVHTGQPAGAIHLKNSFASETPVTDGERVYALFGNLGVFCFDFQGDLIWNRRLAARETRFGWGTAASPALHKDRLYIVNDNDEESFLLALDKRTGEEIWQVARDEKSNWATPFVWENELRTEIITPGTGKVRSYDLDGNLLWWFEGMSSITIATPYEYNGLLYVSSGYVLDQLRPIYAIRPGAEGDISLTEEQTSNRWIAWCQRKAGPYNPTTLIYQDRLFVLYDRGFLAAYDARSGSTVLKRERIPNGRSFTSSPWAYGGKLFFLNEDGVTLVYQAGDQPKLLHRNELLDDDMCMASPAIVGDRLLIRTAARLYCIRNEKAATASYQINPSNCELAAEYHAATNGLAMLVMHEGKVIFEQYDNGHEAGRPYRLASGTKSFWGIAAICAQHDGLLSLDEAAFDTLNEWRSDPQKSKITIRQLLSFSSGLAPDNDALRGPMVKDKYHRALQVRSEHQPGTTFAYGASHLFAFGELLQRKLQQVGRDETPLDYLQRRVLTPIGLKVDRWTHDASNQPSLPFGAFLSAREWSKFGQLLLQDGRWDGEQILPKKLLQECFTGSQANPAYGLNWWLIGKRKRQQEESNEQIRGTPLPSDAVAAKGAGTQRLYVFPALQLVVVRQAESTQFNEREFLNRLLHGQASPLKIRPESQSQPRATNLRWFTRLDSNRDNKLTSDEVPDHLRARLQEADLDRDGSVTREEVVRALAR